jgi:hypothetical protein
VSKLVMKDAFRFLAFIRQLSATCVLSLKAMTFTVATLNLTLVAWLRGVSFMKRITATGSCFLTE